MRALFSILLVLPALSAAAAAAPPDSPATVTQGYVYGTVETRGGQTYTGVLRWGDEEAFWDDLYNASKDERPYADLAASGHRHRSERFEFFGIPISISTRFDDSRQVILRYGDLDQLRQDGKRGLVAVLKGGREIVLDEGSNDQDDAVVVRDVSLGEVEVDQDRITRIVFRSTPPDVAPPPARLWGKVKTTRGEFEGYVQWDSQECLATDKLDGDTEDGRLSIDMGKLRSIARESRRASRVELVDGRTLVLRGTNDVNEDIRGILVETERYGRIKIPWSAFERVDFATGHGSGRPYTAYGPARPLSGKVTTAQGSIESGRLVFDLDEETTAESLNGSQDEIEYYIPFALVRSIERQGESSSKVVLTTGAELLLADENDVDDGNAGLAVPGSGGTPKYISWSDVRRIDFD